MNPIALYYREELLRVYGWHMQGLTTLEHVQAVADEYIAWMKHRKATAPQGSALRSMKIPHRAYLIRALT